MMQAIPTRRLLLSLIVLLGAGQPDLPAQDYQRQLEEQRRQAQQQQQEYQRQQQDYMRQREERERERNRIEEEYRRRADEQRRREEEDRRRADDERRREDDRLRAEADQRRREESERAASRGTSVTNAPRVTTVTPPAPALQSTPAPSASTAGAKAPAEAAPDAPDWNRAIKQGLAAGAIAGGIFFILLGSVRKRDLTAREMRQVVGVACMVTVLFVLEKTGALAPRKGSVDVPASELSDFESKEGRFKVRIPQPAAKTTAMAMGLPINQVTHVSKSGAFAVGYFDVPTYTPVSSQSLDNACTGAVQNMGNGAGSCTETRRTPIHLAGRHEGRDVEGLLPRQIGAFRIRAFLVDRRLYFLTATGTSDWIKDRSVDDFLNSFSVNP